MILYYKPCSFPLINTFPSIHQSIYSFLSLLYFCATGHDNL